MSQAATVLAALTVLAGNVEAQTSGASARGPRPAWLGAWSPLGPLADVPRLLPGSAADFPSLLTAPAPRLGLFWTAGNPGALAFELGDSRLEFRTDVREESGDYARPLDPGSESEIDVAALGWAPVGERGAVVGRFGAGRSRHGDSVFVNVMEPYGSNPMVVVDTVGDPVRRETVGLEGATARRFGPVGLGIALGLEAREASTLASPVPKRARSTAIGATPGVSWSPGNGALERVGPYGRWTRERQQVAVFTISQPSRIFELQGFEDPPPLDLQPAVYRRRFERDAWALGLAAAGTVLGARWSAFGQRERAVERQFSRLAENRPPMDRWEAEGWSAGADVHRAVAEGALLLTGGGRYRALSGAADLQSVTGTVFRSEEERLEANLEVRWRGAEGWQVAMLAGGLSTNRDQRDRLIGARASLRVREVWSGAEVGRSLGRLAVAAGGTLTSRGASGGIPPVSELGPVYRRFVGPELAYAATEADAHAVRFTLRWRANESTDLWLDGRSGSVRPTDAVRLELAPDGSRDGWRIAGGIVLRDR